MYGCARSETCPAVRKHPVACWVGAFGGDFFDSEIFTEAVVDNAIEWNASFISGFNDSIP